MVEVKVKDSVLQKAAELGMDEFIQVFIDGIKNAIGGELTAETMALLNSDQITLLAYSMVRHELLEGGFIQLIHNGYGPFVFLNPFAKAMRLWGAREFSKLIYDGRALYEKYGEELTRDCTDDEFMALYEQYEQFDELDDQFIEMEEDVTSTVAHYIDDHIADFIAVEQ